MTRSHLHLLARPGVRDELGRELDRLEVLLALREQPGLLGLEVLVSEDDSDGVLVAASWSIRRIIEEGYELALEVLREHLDDLHGLAQILIARETIESEQFVRLLHGENEDDVFPAEEKPVPPPPEAGVGSGLRPRPVPIPGPALQPRRPQAAG